MPSRRRLRLGLIGLGKHGARYAKHIREDLEDAALVAIARRDSAKLAEAAENLGARPYGHYAELIASGSVDAVIAVVPPALHPEIVVQACRAGLPILLEKPAVIGLAEGRTILQALRANPVPVMVAHTLRYNTVVRALRAHREAIGTLRSLSFTQRFEPSRLDWLDDPAKSGGGVILHTGVHAFDLLRFLGDLEPDEVTCRVQSVHTVRTEDNFAATVLLGRGQALATVACSRSSGGRNGTIELGGEKGLLIGDHVLHRAERVVGALAEPLPLGAPVPTVRDVLRDFVGALRSGSSMPIPFEDGLRAVALADACYRAALSGQGAAVESIH